MKNKILIICLIIIITLSFNISKTYAGRGCCSWHGGQDYCDTSTGRWVCNDGTYSPSCRCSSEELIDGSFNDNSVIVDDNNFANLETTETIEATEQKNDVLTNGIITTVIMVISYMICNKLNVKGFNYKSETIKNIITITYIFFYLPLLIPLLLGMHELYLWEILSIYISYKIVIDLFK